VGGGKERILGVKKVAVCSIYTYEDSIMKRTEHCLKEGEEGGGEQEYNRSELVQSTLYACVKLPQ
jgi:hypothetical protein